MNAGPWRATVVDVQDPERLCRARLLVPAVCGEVETDWATPMGLDLGAGRDRGIFRVPVVGARVWAFFEDADTDKPVYLGSWPAAPGTPDTADLARGVPDESRADKGSDQTVAAFGAVRQEPADSYAAQYPANAVMKTAGGHVVEVDDTPGGERLHIYHRSGSSIEIDPDGKVIIRCVDDAYTLVNGDRVSNVLGAQVESVAAEKSQRVGATDDREVGAAQRLLVGGARDVEVGGAFVETVGGAKTETIGGLKSETIVGARAVQAASGSEVYAGGKVQTMATDARAVAGARSSVVGGADTEVVGGLKSIIAGGAVSLGAGAALSLSAAGVLTITANQIVLNSSSNIIDNQPKPWKRS